MEALNVQVHEASTPRRDYGFLAIAAFIAIVFAWLLLTPLVPSIASAALHRFHLRSHAFWWWAMQQPVPPMYAFANRYEVRDAPPDATTDAKVAPQMRYLNHFPARVLTFASTRYHYLQDKQDHWAVIESAYRGQRLETVLHAKPLANGGYELVRRNPREARR
jgi:hypothetical protein